MLIRPWLAQIGMYLKQILDVVPLQQETPPSLYDSSGCTIIHILNNLNIIDVDVFISQGFLY